MFFSIPLLIVALGGLFSERSGVINIALEGIMLIGAFAGILFVHIFNDAIPGQLLLILGVLVAGMAGMLFSLVHAYASINMKADQVISGTAINIFAPAFCIFTARMVQTTQQIQFKNIFRLSSVPLLGDIPILGKMLFQNAYITTYIGIGILIISWLVLYKTRFGLRLRSCGELPQAADA
ncbi:MAG: ABC transporter permease, partial [Erysipelotrichaceae bacterium]